MSCQVYGIGNPLIDLVYQVDDADLAHFGVHKGVMHLVDASARQALLQGLAARSPTISPGGDCPNTVINLARLGARACLSGCVGSDEYGQRYSDLLEAAGAVSDLSSTTSATGSSIILVSPDGERTMNTFLGACQDYTPEHLDQEMLAQSDWLYATGYMWDTDSQKAALIQALQVAKANQRSVAFDLADPFAVNRYREDFLWLLQQHVDLVFCNAEELRLLLQAGIEQPLEDLVRRLGALVELAAVKDGSRGSVIIYRGQIQKVRAFPVPQVVDTTGAGDTYAAGFLWGLLNGDHSRASGFDLAHLREAGLVASYLASRILGRNGAQILPEEVSQILHDLENGLHRTGSHTVRS